MVAWVLFFNTNLYPIAPSIESNNDVLSMDDDDDAHHTKSKGFAFESSPKTKSQSTISNASDTKGTPSALSMIQIAVEELETLSLRFFMYDNEPNITTIKTTSNAHFKKWKSYHSEVENDEQMFAALKNSTLRTHNPDEAELFVPHVPLGRIFISKDPYNHINTVMDTLVNHEIFKKHQGNKHVLISTSFLLFREDYLKHCFPMRKWYPAIVNVTAVLCWDPSATYNDVNHAGGIWNEFLEPVKAMRPLNKRSASVGFGRKNDLMEISLATIEKFHDSSNFIFYHSTTSKSFWNSTIFRHAPMNANLTQNVKFPKSSIGWGLEKSEWLYNYKNSKFCLVIRGDNPSSHSLASSIRAGCIPVIISDKLHVWGPILKSSINMSDYGVILNEQDFMNDIEGTLMRLNEMSEAEVEAKIQYLAFAQRVIFTDHPNSLFVPAFLKEALHATEVKSGGLVKL
jgi:hypothetical protein